MINPKYESLKAKHPEWSDEQIWTAISLDMESDKIIEENGSDVNPNDPDIIKRILDGARKWLKEVLPTIFAKVGHFCDNLFNTLGEWVSKGLSYVIDSIGVLLNR